jgi:hypothetical protein
VIYGSRTVNWGANAIGAVYVRTPGSDVITGSGVADYIESSESGAGGTDSISGGVGTTTSRISTRTARTTSPVKVATTTSSTATQAVRTPSPAKTATTRS